MSPLTVGLISGAISFITGWLLCKSYFGASNGASVTLERHNNLLKAQRRRYRNRMRRLLGKLRRHEQTRGQIREKLRSLQQSLDLHGQSAEALEQELAESREKYDMTRRGLAQKSRRIAELEQANAALTAKCGLEHDRGTATEDELSLLVIERDELAARVTRLEAETRRMPALEASDAEHRASALRTELGTLRETLVEREKAAQRLTAQLEESRAQASDLHVKLVEWKKRVRPLMRQLHLQRDLIRRIRTESPRETVEQAPGTATHPPTDDDTPDDLKAIRGIGPALERRLRAHGISRFRQIAEMEESELIRIANDLAIAPAIPQRDHWIEQARELQKER